MPLPGSFSSVVTQPMLQSVSNAVEQLLPDRLEFWQYELDPFFRSVITDAGATRSQFSREWVAYRNYKTGLSGNYRPRPTSSTGSMQMNTAGINFQIYGTGVQSSWASANHVVHQQYHQWAIPLAKWDGTFTMPLDLIRYGEFDANSARQLEDCIEGTAQNCALGGINSWYADNATITTQSGRTATFLGSVLGTFSLAGGVSAAISDLAAGASVAITLASGSIRRFQDGMAVDVIVPLTTATNSITILNENVGSSRAYFPAFITAVDTQNNTFKLVNATGAAWNVGGGGAEVALATGTALVTIAGAFTQQGADPYLVTTTGAVRNATVNAAGTVYVSNGPVSLERTIVYAAQSASYSNPLYGVLPPNYIQSSPPTQASNGIIEVGDHPILKSYVASVGSALDEQILYRHAATFAHAKSMMWYPDVFLTTEGAFASFTESLDGFYQYERNGRPLNIDAGVNNDPRDGGIPIRAFGTVASLKTSPWVSSGVCYGLITKNNNWKRVTPPRLPGAAANGSFSGQIEFVAPWLNGGSSIWNGLRNSSSEDVDMVHAPFIHMYQIIPDILPSMKLTSVAESYGTPL